MHFWICFSTAASTRVATRILSSRLVPLDHSRNRPRPDARRPECRARRAPQPPPLPPPSSAHRPPHPSPLLRLLRLLDCTRRGDGDTRRFLPACRRACPYNGDSPTAFCCWRNFVRQCSRANLADSPLKTELPGVLKGVNFGAHARQERLEILES